MGTGLKGKNGQDNFSPANSSMPSGAGKKVGPVAGRVTRSKGGHNAGTSRLGNGAGLARDFGNGVPTEEGSGPTRTDC